MSVDEQEALPYRPSDDWPSTPGSILPSRAYLQSWRDQTCVAREFALRDAVEYFDDVPERSEQSDLALLGVIGEAMQILEDIAYLGTAWNDPFDGLPNYVRAITFHKHLPTNFWQESPKWDDARIAVFAGIAGQDGRSGRIHGLLDDERFLTFSAGDKALLERVREKALARVRGQLSSLASAWRQFSPYFHAYKHGALNIGRRDVAYVDDDVEMLVDETPRTVPSLAVWRRARGRRDAAADFNLDQQAVAGYAADAGWTALCMTKAFVECRLALAESPVIDDSGQIVGLRPIQLPWTMWLKEPDLSEAEWAMVGRGPRLTWAPSETDPMR